MFYDLNIPKPDSNVEETIQEAIERGIKYGYKVFAITTNVTDSVFDKNKKEKNKKKNLAVTNQQSVIPQPLDLAKFKSNFFKIYFYNRINFKVCDSANIRKFMQFKEIKAYDLISFEPENNEVLKSLTGTTVMDILSYNPENKCELNFSRKLYKQLVNQNVYFELTYGPGIVDSTSRRNLLMLSHLYKALGKSQNIIVTSGASLPLQIRAPHDVMNFNFLFGLSEEQSKRAISKNCEKLLLIARGKRCGKAVIEMSHSEEAIIEDASPEIENK